MFYPPKSRFLKSKGFTLIELVVVIIIIGVLAVTAAPKFIDLSSDAKTGVLQSISGSMKSMISLVKVKSYASGLKAIDQNPGGLQSDYLVDFGFGSAEVDFRNLCPEAQAEGGDKLNVFDYMDVPNDGDITTRTTNQYGFIGYDIPEGNSPKVDQGCYVFYDSFGSPNCTVTVVDADC